MPGERSVVYVLSSYELATRERGLVAAQEMALSAQLPFAVVAIVPGEQISHPPREKLQTIESLLAAYNIPLITMIGDRGQALRALSGHVSPRLCMQELATGERALITHPYAWPGRVQTVGEIFSHVASHPNMCLF